MNLIFVGVQGSGKGTQAKIVAEQLGLCHISTGDLLRGVTGDLKEEVQATFNRGELVSDDLILKILRERILGDDCQKGIILDGFPRNLEQARLLNSEIQIDRVIEIKIDDEESFRRLSGRVHCENCGEGYNLSTAPRPKDSEKCDRCNGKLIQRADDNPIAIKKRIQTYHEDTEPVLGFYDGKVVVIEGQRGIEEISEDILKVLKGD